MQSQKPVLWTMAGNIEKLTHTYHSKFFSKIYCLALVCDEDELRKRMCDGRGITGETWIQSSIDYNNYFKTHTHIGDTAYQRIDTSNKSSIQVADEVISWLNNYK